MYIGSWGKFGTLTHMAEPREISAAELRKHQADVLFAAAAGQTTYITNHGRRVAAIVPVPVAEQHERNHQQPSR